jgi:hypothetical protein
MVAVVDAGAVVGADADAGAGAGADGFPNFPPHGLAIGRNYRNVGRRTVPFPFGVLFPADTPSAVIHE